MSVKSWILRKNKAWKLVIPDAEMKSLMARKPGEGKNCFTLKPTKRKNKVVYFTVDYQSGALPSVWKKVTLFPRGNTPAPPPPALSTQPDISDAQSLQDTQDAIDKVKAHWKKHASTTERLEGEINVKGRRGSLTLIQIPKVVKGKDALLCLFTTFDAEQPGGSPNPDGTGGGSSVRT